MKKAFLITLAILMALSLVACGAPQNTGTEPEKEPEVPAEPAAPLAELPLNETITIDGVAEITPKSFKFSKKLKVGNSTFLSNGTDTDTHFMVVFDYKNLSTEAIDDIVPESLSTISFSNLVYDNTYKYVPGYWFKDDISPLSTGTLVCFYILPQVVADDTKPLSATVKIGTTQYALTVR
ncbi:MAG: hypothetical protein IJP30_03700 [Clostridia bacterium]|nr:hypothetical protein [Clostridia bacterium]